MLAGKRLYKVVLTGGPCAGKTTAKALILERFSSQMNVVCLPELASMTFKSGIKINPATYNFEELVLFTKEFVAMQLKMEDYFERLSHNSDGPTLLVCDRGACDTFGYCSLEVRTQVLQELGVTFHELSSSRYDMVLHLVSCANGAPQFYNTDNDARFETVEEAVECDKRIQAVWKGHPSFAIINNSQTGFMEKMDKVLSAVGHFVGIPESKLVKKFLLQKFITLSDIPPELQANFYREKVIFLKSEDPSHYDYITCKKSNDDANAYYFFKSRFLADKEVNRVELSRQISKEMFKNLVSSRDPLTAVVRRIVYTFVSQHSNKNTEFHRIESYQLDNRRFSLLRVDCECDVDKLAKESFSKNLAIVRDVTGELIRGDRLLCPEHRSDSEPNAHQQLVPWVVRGQRPHQIRHFKLEKKTSFGMQWELFLL